MRVFNFGLAVLAVFTIAMTTQAQSIGVSFGGDNAGGIANGGNASFDFDFLEAGVVRQGNWNNAIGLDSILSGGVIDALDDSGTATTLDVQWASDETWNWDQPQGTSDAILVSGWISVNTIGNILTVDVSEIPYENYDLYIYTGHDRADTVMTVGESNGAFPDYEITENVTVETLAADPFEYVEGKNGSGNYALISNLTAGSLNLTVVGTTDRVSFAGFQIVETEPSVGVLGDANGDGNFDFGDIEAFFLALTDPAAFAVQFPNVMLSLLDMNADGSTDFGDIEAFFTVLTAG